jgi:hypothetical protein
MIRTRSGGFNMNIDAAQPSCVGPVDLPDTRTEQLDTRVTLLVDKRMQLSELCFRGSVNSD